MSISHSILSVSGESNIINFFGLLQVFSQLRLEERNLIVVPLIDELGVNITDYKLDSRVSDSHGDCSHGTNISSAYNIDYQLTLLMKGRKSLHGLIH